MSETFKERIQDINPIYSRLDSLQTLQLNLGNRCNLRCAHCHVEASPSGSRIMGRGIMEKVISFLRKNEGMTLDITGGCPEMNPHFRFLIEGTDGLSIRRMVRSNLVIFNEKGMDWLPSFFLRHQLVVIASLPCYLEKNVDRQRGKGVFEQSIKALRILNDLGYGDSLELHLVYNPGGAFLPDAQERLESAYKEYLHTEYGIMFNKLYTISNAPIGRFKAYLEEKGDYETYLDLLTTKFNPETLPHLMCRTMVSVDWQGILYNCDFNQAIGLPIKTSENHILRIDDLESVAEKGCELSLRRHCYCCTAGEGSSCTGALAA